MLRYFCHSPQHKLRSQAISVPTRNTRHSETVQGSDPEGLLPTADLSFCHSDGVILVLVYCLQLQVQLHPTLCLSTHPFPIHPRSLFFPFLSTFHLLPWKLPSNSFHLVFSGSPLAPRRAPLGSTAAPVTRLRAPLCLGTAVPTLFTPQAPSVFSGSLEEEGQVVRADGGVK